MLTRRNASERGHANHGWLDTWHSFSFADYYDPEEMGYSVLRVINDDTIAGGAGFGTHPHRDMEIITYVLEGGVAHRDSMGTGSIIRPGEVQRMSAGTGVTHSEFNAEKTRNTRLLQIWILPRERNLPPSYEQKAFDDAEKRGRLRLVAHPEGQDGAVTVHQDVTVYVGLFDGEERAELALSPERRAYVHVARGALTVNGERLSEGDGLKVAGESGLRIENGANAEVLVFDLP